MHSAAWDGDIKRIESLVKAGANVNAKDKDGWTPADIAEKNGHPTKNLKLLIDRCGKLKR